MKKYFVVSDIHSFYTPLISALNEAGFDIKNKDHILVVCGDIFDRGYETLQVYKFLYSLPEERRILIRGNHEALFIELLDKDFPERYDFSNGTVRTFCAIAGYSVDMLDRYIMAQTLLDNKTFSNTVLESTLLKNWRRIRSKVAKSNISKFLQSSSWRNYFELRDYIFVHSFIPTKLKPQYEQVLRSFGFISSDVSTEFKEFRNDWHEATDYEWEQAAWGCPWVEYKAGLFKEDKTLVVGHWHTSDFYVHMDNDYTKDNCPIYNNNGIIALDACTAKTGRVNVLVIEE